MTHAFVHKPRAVGPTLPPITWVRLTPRPIVNHVRAALGLTPMPAELAYIRLGQVVGWRMDWSNVIEALPR
ncbi:MAG: hypothetical protein IT459_22690 [Planctomycetes bacterium]|nr:hypothetical protein [Planctomycetota bacterium]